MLPPLTTLQLKAHDDEVFEIRVQEDDDTPIDTTGWHVEVNINKKRVGGAGPFFYTDEDPSPRVTFDRTNPVHMIVWSVLAADTLLWTNGGRALVLQFEVTITDSLGKRRTILDGALDFRGEVLTVPA